METHIDAILNQQLERQKSGFDPGKPEAIGLAFTSFNETDENILIVSTGILSFPTISIFPQFWRACLTIDCDLGPGQPWVAGRAMAAG